MPASACFVTSCVKIIHVLFISLVLSVTTAYIGLLCYARQTPNSAFIDRLYRLFEWQYRHVNIDGYNCLWMNIYTNIRWIHWYVYIFNVSHKKWGHREIHENEVGLSCSGEWGQAKMRPKPTQQNLASTPRSRIITSWSEKCRPTIKKLRKVFWKYYTLSIVIVIYCYWSPGLILIVILISENTTLT